MITIITLEDKARATLLQFLLIVITSMELTKVTDSRRSFFSR
ncbi:unnamed protein product [Brassica oleracea]